MAQRKQMLAAWNQLAVGNLWVGWCGVSGSRGMEHSDLVRPAQIQNCAGAEPVVCLKRLRSQQGKLLSASGPKTPTICPRDITTQAGVGGPPSKISSEMHGPGTGCASSELWFADEGSTQGRPGVALGEQPLTQCVRSVGRVRRGPRKRGAEPPIP